MTGENAADRRVKAASADGTMSDVAQWRSFFSGYRTIVLCANSDAVDIDELAACYGEGTLFVFFNKVFKILSQPFAGESLLVARSSPAGANIVYRGEVETVVSLLRSPRFGGVLNVKAGEAERFSPAEAFGTVRAGHLDLSGELADFYPAGFVPTSGFALALWLVEHCAGGRVVLAGFTARRSEKWKLFHDHEWTFEQIVLRVLANAGKIERDGASSADPIAAIGRRFPDLSQAEIASVAAEVLGERLEGANIAIDRLYSLTRLQARFDGFLRRLKPRTRKAKLAQTKDAAAG